jgi:tetratricopeptide (TPR) repeat protein
LVSIYYYCLNDFRRAIVEADDLLKSYPEQREQCGEALRLKGWAYYNLKDFVQARTTFVRLREEFKEQKTSVESANEGIKRLNALEKG